MQAKLEPSEFAYLLHILNAEKVVGVNNGRLFPAEPSARDTLLNLGFIRLQEHGWLVGSEGGSDANDYLMLMVAVVVDPAYTLTATHYLSQDVRQTLTYYANGTIIVEQFLAADGDYVLTRLETTAELVARLRAVFSPLVSEAQRQAPLTFAVEEFENALAEARAGDPTALNRAVLGSAAAADVLPGMAHVVAELRPAGRIEGAAIAGQSLRAWGELVILRDGSGAGWLVRKDEQANSIELWPAHEEQFEKLVEALLKRLTTDASGSAVNGDR